MYVKCGASAVLLAGLLIAAFQNQTAVDLRFVLWDLNMPFWALVLYASAVGAAIVAVLVLPKLVRGRIAFADASPTERGGR